MAQTEHISCKKTLLSWFKKIMLASNTLSKHRLIYSTYSYTPIHRHKEDDMGILTEQLLILWNMVQRAQRRQRQRRMLANMNEHQLKDIGLTRADALHEAQKPFWMK